VPRFHVSACSAPRSTSPPNALIDFALATGPVRRIAGSFISIAQ
jgi:hypothetical protein